MGNPGGIITGTTRRKRNIQKDPTKKTNLKYWQNQNLIPQVNNSFENKMNHLRHLKNKYNPNLVDLKEWDEMSPIGKTE